MDEYPIEEQVWSPQELVMITSALIKMNRSEIALEVLRSQDKQQEPNLDRLNRVAAESARLGNARVALGVLDIVKHFAMQPDVITYTSAIHACARGDRGDVPVALHLLNEMIAVGVSPNARTYGAAVLAYARMQRWDDIEDMMNTIPYDDDAHKSQVFASAIITCTRNRQYLYATRLFQMLLLDGIYPGDNLCNAALSACARTSDLDNLTRIFKLMETHAKPTIYTFNSMISAYGNARDMEEALRVFQSMGEHGVEPDVVTFNALLLGAVRSRKLDLVPYILSLMSDAGAKWDVYTLNMLLEGCALHGDVEKAERYWAMATNEKNDNQNVRLDRTHFETLMAVYYAAGQFESILNLWQDHYVCRRRAKSSKTLNFLLRACQALRDDTRAAELIEEFSARGLPISSVSHNHLLSVMLAADKLDLARAYLTRLCEESDSGGALATTFSFTAVMKHLLAADRPAEVIDVLEQYTATRERGAKWQNPLLHYPADAVYVLAMRAARALDDHELVLAVYDELPVVLSTTVKQFLLEVAVDSCDAHGDWRAAVARFDEITRERPDGSSDQKNAELYEKVVKIVARAGEFESALDVGGGDWYRQTRNEIGWTV